MKTTVFQMQMVHSPETSNSQAQHQTHDRKQQICSAVDTVLTVKLGAETARRKNRRICDSLQSFRNEFDSGDRNATCLCWNQTELLKEE